MAELIRRCHSAGFIVCVRFCSSPLLVTGWAQFWAQPFLLGEDEKSNSRYWKRRGQLRIRSRSTFRPCSSQALWRTVPAVRTLRRAYVARYIGERSSPCRWLSLGSNLFQWLRQHQKCSSEAKVCLLFGLRVRDQQLSSVSF